MTETCCMYCGRNYGVHLCRRCLKKRQKESGELKEPIKLFPYDKAQKVVKKLGIESEAEYYRYYSSGKLPKGMPSSPAKTYATADSSLHVSRKYYVNVLG
ncbi:MAG: hypothetical protein KJI69_03525 [Patescibacteria group bacterium]|nr:hypothetical protein [Patescibacteria group bacterium]